MVPEAEKRETFQVIQRIEYANEAHTRTAVVVPHEGRWCVLLGDRARGDAQIKYARTMTQCQAWARAWCQEPRS